jgi:hypothetical protein
MREGIGRDAAGAPLLGYTAVHLAGGRGPEAGPRRGNRYRVDPTGRPVTRSTPI